MDRKPHSRDDYIVSKTMFKHMIGMTIFQFTIMVILVFAGDLFIPEFPDGFDSTEGFMREYKYTPMDTVRSGRYIFIDGDEDYEAVFRATETYSRHMTFVFNAFVMMQVFNFVNCRKIQDEVLFWLNSAQYFRRNLQ